MHSRILSQALKPLPGEQGTPWQGAPDREGHVMGGTGLGPRQGREDPEPVIDEVQPDLADPKRGNQGLGENVQKVPREGRFQPGGEVRQQPVM